jgi:hypothetical protein
MLDQTPPAGPAPDLGDQDQRPSTWTTLKEAAQGRGAFPLTLALWVAGAVALGIAFDLVNRGIHQDGGGDELAPPAATAKGGQGLASPRPAAPPRP